MIQQKMDDVTRVITEHNAQIADTKYHINADEVVQKIKLSGGTSEERLRSLSHEDILAVLPVHDGIRPIGVAKEIAKAFRQGVASPSEPKLMVTQRGAERMSHPDLLAAYDVKDPHNAVGKRLKELSRGKPFLILDESGKVLIGPSLDLLMEIKAGFGSRDVYTADDGAIYTTMTVGDQLDLFVDEDPLYPGRPLRPDGTSDQLNRSWKGVPYEVRALLFLAIAESELKVTHETANNVLDIALGSDAFQRLASRYPKGALLFSRKKASQDLPKLKLALQASKPSSSILSQGRPVKFA